MLSFPCLPTLAEQPLAVYPSVRLPVWSVSGGEGDRTPDLVNAIHALSQLSYAPVILSRPRMALWQHVKLAEGQSMVKPK